MVNYDFFCPTCKDYFEDAVEAHTRAEPCPICGDLAMQVWLSSATVRTELAPVDAKNLWAGTPLAGTDGINRVHYRSDKPFVDLGKGRGLDNKPLTGSLEKRMIEARPEKVQVAQ